MIPTAIQTGVRASSSSCRWKTSQVSRASFIGVLAWAWACVNGYMSA